MYLEPPFYALKWLITSRTETPDSMTPHRPPSNDPLGDQLSMTPSGKEVPTAVSMMVDSMTNMIQRAKQDLERVDQRARKDVERLDKKAREDHERLKRD